MSNSDMASKLIAVIVEQRNQIVELEAQVASLVKTHIKLNAKPDPPEPEDAYLSDFRVLKTAIEIISYAMRQKRADWELDLCRKTVLSIRTFTEEVRRWNGLDDLGPYKWSSLGSGVNHLIDKEWEK